MKAVFLNDQIQRSKVMLTCRTEQHNFSIKRAWIQVSEFIMSPCCIYDVHIQQVEKYVSYLTGKSAVLPCCSTRPAHVIILLKRNLFWPTTQSVICSSQLGLDWLFIPSLLVQKVTCAIIPDYSTGKWRWPRYSTVWKCQRKCIFLYRIFKFASNCLCHVRYLHGYWPPCTWFNVC